jgi:hypothetical protein
MRGYITHAINDGTVDYLRMAYALALSLRHTQSTVSALTVVVADGQMIPDNYRDAFDHVIAIPDIRPSVVRPGWRVDSFVQLYNLSPYDETVTLDADMLFFDDVSDWWDLLAGQEIAGGTAYTYKGALIEHNPLRSDFYDVGFPDLHNGFLYFRSGEAAKTLFDAMIGNLASWEETSIRHFGRPDVPFSSDCAFLTALRDCGLEASAVSNVPGIPRFIHMKACLQGWPGVGEHEREWRAHANYYFDDSLSLYIDGQRIGDPFHYHVRDFVTNELLARYAALTS